MATSEKPEDGFDGDPGSNRVAGGVFRGNKAPRADGSNGLFVESEAQGSDNPNVESAAVFAYENAKQDCALHFGFAGFIGERRVGAVSAEDGSHAGTIRTVVADSVPITIEITHAVFAAIADAVPARSGGIGDGASGRQPKIVDRRDRIGSAVVLERWRGDERMLLTIRQARRQKLQARERS